MTDTKTLIISIVLPTEEVDGEKLILSKPDSITVSGLTPEEADGLAESWGQSDTYWVDITSGIIDALDTYSG